MRLLLCGARGKMCRVIAHLSREYGHRVIFGVDMQDGEALSFPIGKDFKSAPPCDCIIDFSSPDAAEDLLGYACKSRTPLVLATTGYSDTQSAKIKAAADQIPIFLSENFSVGMEHVRRIAKALARLDPQEYDAEIIEAHHREKRDVPSGTARLLAETIQRASVKADRPIRIGRSEGTLLRRPGEIVLSSIRAGGIFGAHTLLFSSEDEMIEVRHTAFSRDCFARGAIRAAEFLFTQPPGLYRQWDGENDPLLNV